MPDRVRGDPCAAAENFFGAASDAERSTSAEYSYDG